VVAVNFCVMVVAPWVSDLLLVVVGCWRGVWVAGMGCGVWVWPCGLLSCVVGEVWEKKNYGFLNILIGK
jgi:integral membrane sensor domain MASE1